MKRRIALLFVVATMMVASSLWAASIEGTYDVDGANADGSPYKGTIIIKRVEDAYIMRWDVGTTYGGVGLLNGNTLSVGWGDFKKAGYGVVVYKLGPKGILKGTWVGASGQGIGTETLTPQAR